jgi:F-type H+-transporting ATPase subunit gamma
MATIRTIKRRIKSAKNIGQVTKALEMISAVKMRKAQETALASRPYTEELVAALRTLSGAVEADVHPFLNIPKQIKKIWLVVIGPNKGLAGSLVTNLTRKIFSALDEYKNKAIIIEGISWGKKSKEALLKAKVNITADFSTKTNQNMGEQSSALAKLLAEGYLKHETDLVLIIYSKFVNTVTQKASVIQYLPMVNTDVSGENKQTGNFTFEPNAKAVLDTLLKHYLLTVLNQTILDAVASEHSARMIAMKNASDNARDMMKYLTLSYNQTRQTAITNEIADIVGGTMLAN